MGAQIAGEPDHGGGRPQCRDHARMLVAMQALCPVTKLANKRDRALLSLGWAAALRSELVALNVEDIEHVAGGIHLHIQRNKTDQQDAGQTIAVPELREYWFVKPERASVASLAG
jgi:site-specific recombinase XerC